jgi:hypothetical protein
MNAEEFYGYLKKRFNETLAIFPDRKIRAVYAPYFTVIQAKAKELVTEESSNKQSILINYLMELKSKSNFVSISFLSN